jgi:sucrose-6-phosphate hydrolase SacC (GH32 family)
MGYQNDFRPVDKRELRTDISFDLSDLLDDLKYLKSGQITFEQYESYVKHVKDSYELFIRPVGTKAKKNDELYKKHLKNISVDSDSITFFVDNEEHYYVAQIYMDKTLRTIQYDYCEGNNDKLTLMFKLDKELSEEDGEEIVENFFKKVKK